MLVYPSSEQTCMSPRGMHKSHMTFLTLLKITFHYLVSQFISEVEEMACLHLRSIKPNRLMNYSLKLESHYQSGKMFN